MYSPFDYRFVNLATYRSVPRQDRNHYSFLILSEAGFYYLGNGDLIRCDSCGKINDFLSVTDNPHSATYHNEGCARITTSTDESSQNNEAPESRELLSTFNPTMHQQVQQNINNSSQDENRQNNAASQSSEIQSNAIIHQNQEVPPVEVLRQRGTHIDGAQQASTSTASGELKPNLYATETTESPQHHNTDTKHRNESINIGQESIAAQDESNRFREQSSTIQDSTDGSNDIGQESMTAQEESERSRKQQIRAMWSYYTHNITCRSPSFDIQIRRDFSNKETRLRSFRQWTGYHILDPGDLSLFYYLKGPEYNVKCWKCHESIYIHEGMENISELARELREGRPILCSCAKRLRLLALLLAL